MEAEVNLNFPRSLEGDRHGKYLLCQQLRRLQECGSWVTDCSLSHTPAETHRPLAAYEQCSDNP